MYYQYFIQGRYDSAVEHFNKAYSIARSLNDHATISSSRVLYGVANAHKMMTHFAKHVELANKPCLERLVEWKDNRGDEFDKDIPEGEVLSIEYDHFFVRQ